ncbi:hypothetical protein [Hymenobacter cellulosivorans]|uniref:Uncharacterized protein n=1 Tax=Hymenobacter cellulosivorans TaxID=2932249 RepID=A0ABY4F895_9BACT|nr:hypothetical protein [Hymenobacter cellulosivorans]UOQ52669.1 hypothetical protein MUN80_23350 [Hymenobacter cellulosivorans]
MARVTGNSLLQGLSGTIGGITVRQVGKQTIVSAAEGPKKAPPSDKQLTQRLRMHYAQCYAEILKQDPALKALYATGITDRLKNARLVAITDYLNAPEVLGADLSAYQGRPHDVIRLYATDDFAVTAVEAHLYSATDQLLVQGPAALQPEGCWLFSLPSVSLAEPAIRLEVRAFDRPGNQTLRQFLL